MCLALPGKVVELDKENNIAVIDYGGVRRKAKSDFASVSIGDYVLVHAGFIIQKYDPELAKEALAKIFEYDKEI